MSSTSPKPDDASSPSAPDEADAASPWVVRLFLILAFGLAFGIEGMTLVRGYLLSGEDEAAPVAAEQEGAGAPSARSDGPLRVGDDLLPATAVTERVAEMQIRAHSSGPWTFHLAIAVDNRTGAPYRLTLRALETDDGTVLDDVQTAAWPAGDSTQLRAAWPMGANARPQSLTAEAELQHDGDSTRTVRRRISFGHVPVQMER
ncbi:hypothetical protein [Salinibacter altiplanensis]|uniref:hypothetical protein n=1 Tax=Salinibacter altiplanensis TaxID=1803181 RepID=UPI001E486097|nr:hypothetical protein [Salinibacter altiplanensis]